MGSYWWFNRFMVIEMSELRFKDITDSLVEGFDPILREELFSKLETLKTDDEALRGVQLFIQKHGRDYDLMRSTFISFYQILEAKEKQGKKINLSWIKYAAVLVIVVGIGYYYYKNKPLDLTAYEYKDAGLPVLMGSDGNINFNNGMSAFKMQDFQKAYTELEKCTKTDTVIFYKGLSAYEGGDYEKAFYHMNEIPIESIYYGKSLYLNCLCNIHMGKNEDAKLTLQVIVLTQPEFKEQATELIEKLK